MRYELSDYEWTAIKPMLPNKPRGVVRSTIARCSTAFTGGCAPARLGPRFRALRTIDDLLQPYNRSSVGP